MKQGNNNKTRKIRLMGKGREYIINISLPSLLVQNGINVSTYWGWLQVTTANWQSSIKVHLQLSLTSGADHIINLRTERLTMTNFTPIQASSFANFICTKRWKAIMQHETLAWRTDQGIQTLSIPRCSKGNSAKDLYKHLIRDNEWQQDCIFASDDNP